MRNLNFLNGAVLMFLLVFTGCALTKSFAIDRDLMETQHIFKSSQEPGFSMKLAEGTIYKDTLDKREASTALSYVTKTHRFINKKHGYIILIDMTTVSLAEWGSATPWEREMGNEIHGIKTFQCGIGTMTGKVHDGKKLPLTYKGWMYTPGGIGTPGTTRIVVYYLEAGDQRDNLENFVARADNRVNFSMQ